MSERRIIYLDQLRPGDPDALCGKCGCGTFKQSDPDDPWVCAKCGELRCTAAAVAQGVAALTAKPTLVYRCKCASVLWRVGMGGIECSVCLTAVSFEVLFEGGRK